MSNIFALVRLHYYVPVIFRGFSHKLCYNYIELVLFGKIFNKTWHLLKYLAPKTAFLLLTIRQTKLRDLDLL